MTNEEGFEENNLIAEEIMSLYDELENINSSLTDIAKSLRVMSNRPSLNVEPIEHLSEEDEE